MCPCRVPVVSLGAGLLLASVSAGAHHSFSVAFDADTPITVQGVVTRVQWESPHSWIFVDVKDAGGKVVNWGFEGWPPAMLTINPRFGPQWQAVRGVLTPRLAKLAVQVEF